MQFDEKNLIIRQDQSPLHVNQEMLANMKLAFAFKSMVLWDYQGLQHRIPDAVINNLITLYDDFYSRPAVVGIHRIPKHAMVITWEQTEPIK